MDESFKTGTGLADSLDLHITDAAFVLDAGYGRDGELIPLLKLGGTATIDGQEKPLHETWPVGKGWQVADDGARIVSAKNTKINSNTDYGKFVDALVAIDGATDLLDKITDASAFTAATWVGWTLHLEREKFPYDFTGDDGKQVKGVKSVLLPTEVLGHELGVQQALPVNEAVTVEIPEIPQEFFDAATKATSYEEFIDVAYALGLENEPYEPHVSDEGPKGFFATNKGK